jgi:hypothetical protein
MALCNSASSADCNTAVSLLLILLPCLYKEHESGTPDSLGELIVDYFE